MKLCSGTSLAISPIIASYIIPSRATIGGSGGNERYLAAARTPIGELKWNKAAESPAGSWPARLICLDPIDGYLLELQHAQPTKFGRKNIKT